MHDDLGELVGAFHGKQALHVLVPLRALLTGVDLDYPPLVATVEDVLEELDNSVRVLGVRRDDEHERLYFADAVLLRIDVEFDLH